MGSAVGILLVARVVPLRELVSLKLGSQRFKDKFGDRTLAPDVRPQRHGPFSPTRRRNQVQCQLNDFERKLESWKLMVTRN